MTIELFVDALFNVMLCDYANFDMITARNVIPTIHTCMSSQWLFMLL